MGAYHKIVKNAKDRCSLSTRDLIKSNELKKINSNKMKDQQMRLQYGTPLKPF